MKHFEREKKENELELAQMTNPPTLPQSRAFNVFFSIAMTADGNLALGTAQGSVIAALLLRLAGEGARRAVRHLAGERGGGVVVSNEGGGSGGVVVVERLRLLGRRGGGRRRRGGQRDVVEFGGWRRGLHHHAVLQRAALLGRQVAHLQRIGQLGCSGKTKTRTKYNKPLSIFFWATKKSTNFGQEDGTLSTNCGLTFMSTILKFKQCLVLSLFRI